MINEYIPNIGNNLASSIPHSTDSNNLDGCDNRTRHLTPECYITKSRHKVTSYALCLWRCFPALARH